MYIYLASEKFEIRLIILSTEMEPTKEIKKS